MSENTMNRRDALRRLVAVPVGILTGEAMWDALDRLTHQRRLWAGHAFEPTRDLPPIPVKVWRKVQGRTMANPYSVVEQWELVPIDYPLGKN